MSSVVISGDTSGAITLAAPAVSGTNTATLPAATGTVMVSGNMPAFRAYLSTNTTISAATYTTIALDTKSYDTANCYSTSTYRFTPNVAGYYLVNLTVSAIASATQLNPTIAKNGTRTIYGTVTNGISGYAAGGTASDIVYMNGSTDYITAQVYIGTNPTMFSGTDGTVLSASLIRSA